MKARKKVAVAQLIADFPAGASLTIEIEPKEEFEVYESDTIILTGTDVDVFKVSFTHPGLKKYTLTLNEGCIVHPIKSPEPLQITAEAKLEFEIENTDTANAHRFEAVIPYTIKSKSELLEE